MRARRLRIRFAGARNSMEGSGAPNHFPSATGNLNQKRHGRRFVMTTPFKWGDEFLVNTTTTDGQSDPAITALADGRFIVAWMDQSATGDDTWSWAVRAQIFNADGSKS